MKSSLNDNFCSSPWFHIRVDPRGNYLPCRWGDLHTTSGHNVSNTSIHEYVNSNVMRDLRVSMLEGKPNSLCSACYYEDSQHKVSGRQKQLLKSAVHFENFDKTFCSSPHWPLWSHSYKTQGHTDKLPVDLQIDLGNTCNSACVMCDPVYSSRLATDWRKLNKVEPRLFPKIPNQTNWTDDPLLVEKFVKELASLPEIKYIHFLGGETLYLNSFYEICERLIELDIAKDISIGTTTNCTVYTPELEHVIKNFKHVHLGLSIETATSLNDYIRYPSKINQVLDNIQKFVDLRGSTGLHLSLRITPSVLTFYHIDSIFRLMLDKGIIAESCNILREPTCLRPELLPKELATDILNKINSVIDDYNLVKPTETIVNTRRDDLANQVMAQTIFEYKQLVEHYTLPLNVESERRDLVTFIKGFESLRNNNILEHLPEYEKFLRSYGY